jgi:hypothetical protein
MTAVRVEATIQTDGELHLTQLPYRQGEKVEAIVLGLEQPVGALADADREAAREQFLKLTRTSSFRSTAPYPARDELHERT